MKSLILVLFMCTAICAQTFAQKITTDKVPAPVMETFKSKFPKAEGAKWEMEEKKDFEVNFKMNGEEMSATFDPAGKWLETESEIEVSNLPAAVKKKLDTKFAGYKIKEAENFESPDKGKIFEIEVIKDKERIEVQVTPAGEIVNSKVEKEKEDEKNGKDEKD